jgi:serine/threonine-protein kinase
MPSSTSTDDTGSLRRALAGQYSIDREIGRGGMGIVYLAREVILDRLVALKVLPAALAENPDASERFLREARTAAKLFHPHIVPIHRVDHVGDAVFIAMGFVDGQSAGQRIAADGPMPITEAVRVLRETAWALGYAHARGVIHRDIKPDNLLLERDGGRTFVTDFGIAHVEGTSALTRDGQMFGSVSYMSPEQISGGAIDGRSDLYSLGIVAHELLTGKLPFTHDSATAVLAMHLNTPAPPIASLVPGISPRLAAAIDRCLAKDPAARHESVDAFAAALAEVERPKEVPAALRAWIAGTGLVDAGFWILVACVFLFVASVGGGWWAFGIPLSYAAVQRSRQTRRLMGMGFGIEDIRGGLANAIQREGEETAAQRPAQMSSRWSRVAQLLRSVARIAGWTFVAYVGVGTLLGAGSAWIHAHPQVNHFVERWLYPFFERSLFAPPLIWIGARFGAELIAPTSPASLKQREYRLRLRFWSSKIGARFARLLRAGLGRTRGAVRTDQPTEVMLGAAAASMFDALPKDIRQQLPELPMVVRGLEERAGSLRSRIADLEHVAAQVHPAPREGRNPALPALDDRRGAFDADLATSRRRAEEQLGVAVAALETIRLDLLRLQAGNDSVGDLTANVAAAAALAVEIDRLLESREAVEQLLSRTNPSGSPEV